MPDIFKAILYEDVFYPLSISLEAFEILQGVRKASCDFLILSQVNASKRNC